MQPCEMFFKSRDHLTTFLALPLWVQWFLLVDIFSQRLVCSPRIEALIELPTYHRLLKELIEFERNMHTLRFPVHTYESLNTIFFIVESMIKRNYIEDLENVLKGRKKPIELLNIVLGFFDFKAAEIKIYNLLLKSSLTIKQIEKQLNLSERTIRKYIKRLDQKGFITRKVEQGKRLKYIYMAVPVQKTWKKVKDRIQKMIDEITKVLETKAVFF